MITVVLEVQLMPCGDRHHNEFYFCRELQLPFRPMKGDEFMLEDVEPGCGPNQFDVQWVQWIEATGHLRVRLELTPHWDEIPPNAFDLDKWQLGDYWHTFGREAAQRQTNRSSA